jgi:hypothetical protein
VRGILLFLVFFCISFSGRALDAIVSLSNTFEIVPGEVEFYRKLESMVGLEIQFPLLFREKIIEETRFYTRFNAFIVAPLVTVEHSYFRRVMKIRTGLHVGRFHAYFLSFTKSYAGLYGAFLRDFEYDITAIGIAPEIGGELYLYPMGKDRFVKHQRGIISVF